MRGCGSFWLWWSPHSVPRHNPITIHCNSVCGRIVCSASASHVWIPCNLAAAHSCDVRCTRLIMRFVSHFFLSVYARYRVSISRARLKAVLLALNIFFTIIKFLYIHLWFSVNCHNFITGYLPVELSQIVFHLFQTIRKCVFSIHKWLSVIFQSLLQGICQSSLINKC